jgi:hypothetical protein
MQAVSTSAPAHAATTGQSGAIPFAEAGHSAAPGNFTGLMIAAVLLAVAFVVLYIFRQRGLGRAGGVGATSGALKVVQRLRISGSCEAFVLDDAGTRLVVIESRHGLQVVQSAGAGPSSHVFRDMPHG